jgi:SAM-dependent methyltransferase
MDIIEELRALYADESKHSVYQNTPAFIREKLGYTETIDENWRGDSARWDYLRENIDFSEKSVLDVGANTGFFALSIAHRNRNADVTALEGNGNHSRYIETIAEYFEMPNVRVLHQYLAMEDLPTLGHYDTVLLFNVLHHAGADFDKDNVRTEAELFSYCVRYMKQLADKCTRVIFQMGYNWGGNKLRPVVELNDDVSKVIYTAKFMIEAGWEMERILLPRSCKGKPYPAELSELPQSTNDLLNNKEYEKASKTIERVVDPEIRNFSEFYRRPLFICKTRH